MVTDSIFKMLVIDLMVNISLSDKPRREVGWQQLRYRSVNGFDSWLKLSRCAFFPAGMLVASDGCVADRVWWASGAPRI